MGWYTSGKEIIMLCQRCHKNPATARYVEVVDGQVVQQHICPDCLSQYQEDNSADFSLTASKPTVRTSGTRESTIRTARKSRRACPACGRLLEQILETAVVGCPACYEHFGREVESLLEGLHRVLRHQGKAQRVDDVRAKLHGDLQTKRILLRSVLRVEDYEQAARLRDEIRRLEEGLHLSEAGMD